MDHPRLCRSTLDLYSPRAQLDTHILANLLLGISDGETHDMKLDFE